MSLGERPLLRCKPVAKKKGERGEGVILAPDPSLVPEEAGKKKKDPRQPDAPGLLSFLAATARSTTAGKGGHRVFPHQVP